MRIKIGDQEQRELVGAVQREAARIGMAPETMLTIMAYETGGTLDPWQKGPKTQWGTHRGLIQMGGPQRKQYGYSKDKSIAENVRSAADYFVDRGWRPGMSEVDAYSIVNAGAPGLSHRTDQYNGGAPGTVADKVASSSWRSYADQMKGVLAKYGGDDLSQFVNRTENAAILSNLMAGQPGIPSSPGIFDTYQALNDMNVTAAPTPVAKRDNPANPSFSDNSVGPLAQRDYGYQTARTVDDLRRALGGPEPNTLTVDASGQAGPQLAQNQTGAANLGGLFAEGPTDFSAVQPTMSDGLSLFDPIGPEMTPSGPSGPPQRLGPRRVAETVSDSVATSDVLPDTPGVQFVQPQEPISAQPQQSPLQPLPPAQTVAPRQVAPPQEPQLDLVPNAAPSVADSVSGYGLFGDAGDGFSYGYSPWGSGVAKVHDSADDRTKIAATGSGLFGAFNKEFGTNIGLSPGKMMTPLASALGAGAAVAGLGPLALAIPAANALGGTNWLANKMDAVPREQWQQPRQNNGFLSNLFNGNPLQNFAGGLFNAPQKAANAVGGLFGGNSNQNEVSFNGPIGRNQRDVSLDSMSQAARNEIERATRGLY